MAIIVMMLALYGFFNFVAYVGRGAKKTARKGSAAPPHYESEEWIPEEVTPPNVVEMVSQETKKHVSAVIRRAQQTGKWIEAILYLSEQYSGASLQYARKRVQAAYRAEKGAGPSKKVVNGDPDRTDETDGSDDSFE